MIKPLFLIIFLFLTLSCVDPASTVSGNSSSLYVTDSLLIDINANEYFASIQNHIVNHDQKPLLLRESRMHNAIVVYDLEEKTKINSISYPLSGPNEISNFASSAFHPFTLDSILIADLFGNYYFTRGNTVSQKHKTNKFRFFGENSYKPVRIEDKIYMHTASNFRQTNPKFYKDFSIIGLNLTNGKFKAVSMEYPDRFKSNCWSEHHWYVPFTSNNKGQLIVSFSTEPVIKVYDSATETVVAEHKIKSDFAGEVDPLPNCDPNDLEQYPRYLQNTPRYLSLTFDPHKNVYYRIIALPVSGVPNGQRDFQNVQPFTLMVLDKDFQVITEKVFPGMTYDVRDFFVTQEGLWISRNNKEAEDFSVNRIIYDLISFKED